MGYSTDFSGQFELDEPLTATQVAMLDVLADTRHDGRNYPGIWCQWVPTEDGEHIKWNGGEKFYNYVEWIEYIVTHFLTPWGRKINGVVEWQGKDSGDFGRIVAEDNVITVQVGRKVFE